MQLAVKMLLSITLACATLDVAAQALESHAGAREAFRALSVGDRAAIEAMRRDGKIGPSVSRFSDAAIIFDRKAASSALNECRSSAEKSSAFQDAVTCGIYLAGVNESLGDAKGWAASWLWVRNEGLKLASGSGQRVAKLGGGYDEVNFMEIEKSTLQPSYDFASEEAVVDRLKMPNNTDKRFYINIEINGEVIAALVDTGASTTLALPSEMAEKMGLRRLATGLTVIRSGVSSLETGATSENAESYYLADVKVGNLLIKNLMILGTERDLINPVIGFDLLGMFEEIEFQEDHVKFVSRDRSTDCAHPSPLFFLPTQRFDGKFATNLRLDGRNARASVDTGAGNALTIVGAAARGYASSPTTRASVNVAGRKSDVDVAFVDMPITVSSIINKPIQARVVQGPITNVDAILGATYMGKNFRISLKDGEICYLD